jgi:hypothetical protein
MQVIFFLQIYKKRWHGGIHFYYFCKLIHQRIIFTGEFNNNPLNLFIID